MAVDKHPGLSSEIMTFSCAEHFDKENLAHVSEKQEKLPFNYNSICSTKAK